MSWKLVRRIELEYARTLKAFAKEFFALTKNMDNPHEIIKAFKHMSNNKTFELHCINLAAKMVTMINVQNCKSWRAAAAKGSRGREIYDALKAQLKDNAISLNIENRIWENALLIKTLPLNISHEITDYVASETFKGVRASDIADYIKTVFPEKTKANAALIARTEVSKTQSALTQARAENIGIRWYIWRTSSDGSVRSSHEHMAGVLVDWSNPPNPEKLDSKSRQKPYGTYHAGCTFNCRCYAEPVVSLDFVKFPANVHYAGKITTMGRCEFEKII